jgi:uncharacterized protein YbbK (DUF523 family)
MNVLSSACCCGITCRWHGKPARESKVVAELRQSGLVVWPVCPEMLGGLPCPRPPVKTRKGRIYETDPETRTQLLRELTAQFEHGAVMTLQIARKLGCMHAYMLRTSPSCAPGGIAGKMLREAGIEVVPIW